MTQEFFSLREIGRRLRIPPSSVVYYKDRFERFIPHAGGGRRKRYTAQALPIFKEIRAMFDKNWSAEQIEATLARQFHAALHPSGLDETLERDREPAPEFVHSMSGVLEKVSSLLENQSLFRAEIDSLRLEVAALKQEKQDLEAMHKSTIARLEAQISDLEREKSDLLRRIMDRLDMEPHAGSQEAPPAAFLNLPLVIRNEQGEYLGVAGKTGHFSLREFLAIIRNGDSAKRLDMAWQPAGQAWILRLATRKTATKESHEHEMELAETLTPSGNRVIRLQRLVIDGNTVPEPFLLMLFRKIKDGFEE